MRISKLCFISLVLIVVFQSSLPLYAQHIQGVAKSLAGKKIGLYTYSDFISFEEKKLAEVEVSNTGNFVIDLKVQRTTYCFLKSGTNYSDFFIQPGKSYSIVWPDFTKKPDEARPYFDRQFRKVIFQNLDSLDLNASINRFNSYYDQFLEKNAASLLVRGRSAELIKALRRAAYTQFGNITDPAFRNYVDYNLAIVEQITPVRKEVIYSAYIKTKPVRPYDLMYMDFFAQFFEKYLHNYVLSKKNPQIYKILNAGGPWINLDNELKNIPFLANDSVRALVTLINLRSLLGVSGIQKESVKKMFKLIERESPMEFIRIMAGNLLRQSQNLVQGTKAPAFVLENSEGEQVSLDELKGKFVYLEVTDPNCSSCLSESKVIPIYRKKYGDKIRFITVLLKSSQSRAKAFKELNKFDWEVLFAPSGSDFSELYDIKSVPQYFIIGPDGKFFRSPAEKPSHNAEKDFSDIKFKY